SGPGITLLDGNLGTSLINVTSGSVNLKLQYMTLANGKTSGDGGAILSQGNLTLDHVTFQNNHAARHGGAISIETNGSITATDCMFLDDFARGELADAYGGAVYANAGTLRFTR